ncbi:hypothetical protein Q8F55_006400 [Vanrija albida]|uniref:Peptidase M20 dimerisation domain-containing protein n=1 Tax=Vanrija albida TaxID=181172 RepID=A0ABR3PXT4_9TREE
MTDKAATPLPAPASSPSPSPADAQRAGENRKIKFIAGALLALFVVVPLLGGPSGCAEHAKSAMAKVAGKGHKHHGGHKPAPSTGFCPAQPAPLNVGDNWDPATVDGYPLSASQRLARAVQINTVSQDNAPADPKDPAFDGHYKFAEYLEAEFPKVYGALEHEAVNTHGHLYTWKGSDEGLKPVYLMAHEDTVPVNPETLDQWTHGPWEGAITTDEKGAPGTWIWGRGASDCKNSLVGILAAVEKLVDEGWTPERTVLIGFGFDEEISGGRGAGPISALIEERYGADGIAFLVDEGFSGVEDDVYGLRIASLGMAEKGSTSVKLTVDTLGGHSSVPPPHTGIGYISRFIAKLEDNPFKPELTEQSPYLKYLSCLSEYAPAFPSKLSKALRNPKKWGKLAKKLASKDRVVNAFLSTTTAVDLINGGVKVNALPEVVTAVVNHRVSFVSTVNDTRQHYLDVLVPYAKKLGFSVTAFGNEEPHTDRHLTIEAVPRGTEGGLEPAPHTPSDAPPFALLAGTIKTVFGEDTIVSPTGMYANTDTARTWRLTKHIFRFNPARLSDSVNVHTVNERMNLDGHLSTIRFYYKLLHNTAGWTD